MKPRAPMPPTWPVTGANAAAIAYNLLPIFWLLSGLMYWRRSGRGKLAVFDEAARAHATDLAGHGCKRGGDSIQSVTNILVVERVDVLAQAIEVLIGRRRRQQPRAR